MLETAEKAILNPHAIDETGAVYGYLTVLYPVSKKKATWWACRCECGDIKVVRGSRLRRGMVTHCGCKLQVRPYKDYVVGKKYNMLTVLRFVRKTNRNTPYYLCKCDCGEEKVLRIDYVVSGATKSCGCLRGETIGDYIINYKRLPLEQAAIKSMYKGYGASAERRGIPFELTKELFAELIKQNCHYCGSEPSPSKTKVRKSDPDAVFECNGVDRIDSSAGYTPCNSVACCPLCNKMKSALSISDFLDHVSKINYFQMFKNVTLCHQ